MTGLPRTNGNGHAPAGLVEAVYGGDLPVQMNGNGSHVVRWGQTAELIHKDLWEVVRNRKPHSLQAACDILHAEYDGYAARYGTAKSIAVIWSDGIDEERRAQLKTALRQLSPDHKSLVVLVMMDEAKKAIQSGERLTRAQLIERVIAHPDMAKVRMSPQSVKVVFAEGASEEERAVINHACPRGDASESTMCINEETGDLVGQVLIYSLERTAIIQALKSGWTTTKLREHLEIAADDVIGKQELDECITRAMNEMAVEEGKRPALTEPVRKALPRDRDADLVVPMLSSRMAQPALIKGDNPMTLLPPPCRKSSKINLFQAQTPLGATYCAA